MMLRLGLVAALSFLGWSCSGDEEKASEPVANEEGGGKLPETPGADAGAPGALPGAEDPAAAGALGNVNPSQEPAPAPQAGGADYNAQAAAPAAEGATDHVVKVGALNVRKGPGTKHAVVRTLKKGEKVQSWGCKKNWCKIGEGEYVSKKYLKQIVNLLLKVLVGSSHRELFLLEN